MYNRSEIIIYGPYATSLKSNISGVVKQLLYIFYNENN